MIVTVNKRALDEHRSGAVRPAGSVDADGEEDLRLRQHVRGDVYCPYRHPIVSASLRDIGGGLSAADDETVWVQTSYLIAEIIIIPLSGWLARVMSTRWLFAASAAGFTLMSLLCGWAWNIQSLIAFRALQGLAGGSMIPWCSPPLSPFFRANSGSSPRRQSAAPPSLAPTLGPTVGGWITENYNWHWLFFINVVRGFASRWQCRCW